MEYAALIISGLSALGTLYAVLVSVQSNQQNQNSADAIEELTRRMVEIEEGRDAVNDLAQKKAIVRMHGEQRGHALYNLIVENESTATATEIRVLVDGQPLEQHPSIHDHKPIATLLGGASHAFTVMPTGRRPKPAHARIEWCDESGERRSWESDIRYY
jgi:hypothetical protein